jgi:hypothetical protein
VTSATDALEHTPGPPPVPLGAPLSRDLGAAGDPRPPLPGFATDSEADRSRIDAGRLTTPEAGDNEDERNTGEPNE